MRILAISAHPDDVEINCAGTLTKYRNRGDVVGIMHATTGDKGHFVIKPEELGPMRCLESQRGGAVIGAQVISLGYPDGEVYYSQDSVEHFTREIRRFSPDVIITHTPDDYHIDHAMVSKIVLDASFLVTVPHFLPDTPAMDAVPQIYFMEPYTGMNFVPDHFVDITDTLSTKLDMMRCHESQVDWLLSHDGLDILGFIETSAKYRGFQCGCQYAEGFVRYINALRARPGCFLP